MASIRRRVADHNQGEGPSPPHQSVEELKNGFPRSQLLVTPRVQSLRLHTPTTTRAIPKGYYFSYGYYSLLWLRHSNHGHPRSCAVAPWNRPVSTSIFPEPFVITGVPKPGQRTYLPTSRWLPETQFYGRRTDTDGLPTVTTSPGVAVYPSPFNQTFGAYPVSSQRGTSSSTPVNRGDMPPACSACQAEGNGSFLTTWSILPRHPNIF
ncbi:hypothetical protein EDB86DRAFT_2835141 [Lactarius hatsudake]|nr:hypothetical protein EDB86DRAFT_2835141 [Lactarius hatsudake]